MSIRNYFRPRNGLSEPTGSTIALPWKVQIQELQVRLVPGQLNISCALLLYLPLQELRTHPRYLSRQISHDSPFFFRGHSVSFSDSLSHTNDSPTAASLYFFIRGSLEYSNSFRKTLPWQLLSPYVSSPRSSLPYVHVPRESRSRYYKHYVKFLLKYFRRTSTLRKFFNTKIFPTKISYSKNFPTYSNTYYIHTWKDRVIILPSQIC